mgnify:CR=1 FL=1
MRIGNRIYVDGGVVSPVAVRTARRYGADVVIAVDISSFVESIPQGTIETLLQAVDIMYARIGSNETDGADVVIRPKTRQIGSADFSKRHEAILEGEMAAAEAMPKIRRLFQNCAPKDDCKYRYWALGIGYWVLGIRYWYWYWAGYNFVS